MRVIGDLVALTTFQLSLKAKCPDSRFGGRSRRNANLCAYRHSYALRKTSYFRHECESGHRANAFRSPFGRAQTDTGIDWAAEQIGGAARWRGWDAYHPRSAERQNAQGTRVGWWGMRRVIDEHLGLRAGSAALTKCHRWKPAGQVGCLRRRGLRRAGHGSGRYRACRLWGSQSRPRGQRELHRSRGRAGLGRHGRRRIRSPQRQ